jgi:urease accessory protein
LNNLALLKLMHLVSPALPVGAYAYSQGQEWAVDSAWVNSEPEVEAWIMGVLGSSVAYLDLPCLSRLYDAWQTNDLAAISYWNNFIFAARETHELLLEDQQMGIALSRLLVSLAITEHQQAELTLKKPSFIAMFALAGVKWNIPLDALKQGFVWSWLEAQVGVATKIVPLGQTQAQQMLTRMIPKVDGVIDRANGLEDHELGMGLPALAIASSLHERQYSRIFRS